MFWLRNKKIIFLVNCIFGKLSELKAWKLIRFLKRHLLIRQLVFWLMVVSSFNNFKMHAWCTSMLLLLHSAFMLSVVKLLLKGEVGGCAFNSHGNYIVDHRKSWKIMELSF